MTENPKIKAKAGRPWPHGPERPCILHMRMDVKTKETLDLLQIAYGIDGKKATASDVVRFLIVSAWSAVENQE